MHIIVGSELDLKIIDGLCLAEDSPRLVHYGLQLVEVFIAECFLIVF